MEMNTEMPAPAYFIYREIPPNGDPFDTTAPPVFFPAKDSDELFDALRIKYPHVKTHSERMRDAIIEFLLEERRNESLSANTSPTMPSLYDSTAATSPWQHSWPSVSSTTLSSPETMAMGTPSFEDSPRSHHPQLARHTSTATTSTASPPVLENMTSVFSLSTSEQPKQRVRRKMTESEKIEYRKRRIVKACEKCSKRKRKCNHNQHDMEDATTGKTAHKVAKPRAAATTTKTVKPQRAHEASASFVSFDFQPMDFTPIEGFEDFTLMLDEPMPELTFDDFLDMEQNQAPANVNAAFPVDHFPWDNTQFWTPVDSVGFDDKGFDDLADLTLPPRPLASGPLDSISAIPHPHDTQLENATMLGQGTRHTTNHDRIGNALSMYPRVGTRLQQRPQEALQQGSPSINMPWEHLRTGQVEPTHTKHVHDALAQGDNNPFGPGYAPGGSRRLPASLPQTVTQLVGTAKAVRAFSDLLSRDVRDIPLAKVAGLVGLASSRTRAGIASACASNGDVLQRRSDLLRHTPNGRADNPQHNIAGSLQDIALADTIRANSNFQLKEDMITQCISPDNSIRAGSWLTSLNETKFATPSGISDDSPAPSVPPTALRELGFTKYHSSGETAFTPTAMSRGEVASTSALTAQGSIFDNDPSPQGWSSSALRSDADSTRPSTEMYRLKRRLPRALHSIVSKNRVQDGLADTPNLSATVHPVAIRDEGLNARLLQAGAEDARSLNGSANFTIGKRVANRAASPSIASDDRTNPDLPRTAGTRLPLNAFASTLQQGRTTIEGSDLKAAQHLFSESDTRRYRDHHGRPTITHSSTSELALLIAILAFTTFALHAASTFVDPSVFLLALLCPIAAGNVKGGHASERVWRNWHRAGSRVRHAPRDFVRCSEENSGWLARLPCRVVELWSSSVEVESGACGEVRRAGGVGGR